MFIILRFIQAAATFGMAMVVFVLMTELVGHRWRVILSSLHLCSWAIAYSSISGIAYFIRDSFQLQLVLAIISNILYLCYYWVVPESPRWLLSMGRETEFKQIVQKIASMNKKRIPDDMLLTDLNVDSKREDTASNVSFLTIVRDPYAVVISIVQCFLWFTVSGVYFGLSLNASSLAGNVYVNNFISGAIEVPGFLCVIPIYAKLGRRSSAAAAFSLAATALLLTVVLPSDAVTAILICSAIGKFAVSTLFNMIYLYSAELFPTSFRSTGMSICSTCARVASMTAPFTADLAEVFPGLPQFLFSLLCVIAALSLVFLPETKGRVLPQTLDEIKRISGMPWWMRCCREKPTESDQEIQTLKQTNGHAAVC